MFPTALHQCFIHLSGRPDALIKWKQIVWLYLWDRVFLSCCCGTTGGSWGRTTQRVISAAGDLWPLATELWGDHRTATCTHTSRCKASFEACRSRTLTHMLRETMKLRFVTDPRSNRISGKHAHKWLQQSFARLVLHTENGKLGCRLEDADFVRCQQSKHGQKTNEKNC